MAIKGPSNAPVNLVNKPLKTTEEFDCERRGYKLTKTCLGAGAYAKVKLAYVTSSKLEKDKRLAEELKEKGITKVAVKIISRKSAPKEYVNKFMPREIETLHATYRFPNIVQLYETFRTESRVYLVMEYASKGDLLEFINSQTSKTPGIGEARSKNFFKQLLSGIQHCHRRNVVHRDLKCENLLIDDDEVLKVSDFGFATRFPTNKQKLLETFCGSYAYAAPEILQAEKYDGKIADIWSLGIILFAMLNGRLPYNDRDIRTLIEQTKSKPRFSSRINVTSECQDLVCKILTTNIQDRATLEEIARHPWLTADETAEEKASRGVPDGKSDEIVTSEIVEGDVVKYNLQENKKVAYQPHTQRVLQHERRMSKAPQPQAIQKLLHSRAPKLPEKSHSSTSEAGRSKVSDGSRSNKSKGGTSSASTCGKISGTNTEKKLPRYWGECTKKPRERQRKELITGILPNNYRPEPVVKKIAFGGSSVKTDIITSSNGGTTYRLAYTNKRPKNNPPVISALLNNSDRTSLNAFSPSQKVGRKECMLPPVNNSNKNNKVNSAPCKYPQQDQHFSPDEVGGGGGKASKRQSGQQGNRQASAASPKQYKTKAIQNFTFNHPGINIEVVTLRRNWQKMKQSSHNSPTSTKEDTAKTRRAHPNASFNPNAPNNVELTYYTLSGKEVNIRDQIQSPKSVNGVYTR